MKFANRNFKNRYQRNIELSLVLSLCTLIFVFQGWKQFDKHVEKKVSEYVPPVVVDVIRTIHEKKIPKPPRPQIPVFSDDSDTPINDTIDETVYYLDDTQAPPKFEPDVEDTFVNIFIPHDTEPYPIGGFQAIFKHLKYPEIARKAGVEGKVIVNCFVDVNGNVIKTLVIQSLGNNGCDEAAVAAIRSVKWQPAMQRDKPVKVWVAIPVHFKLK